MKAIIDGEEIPEAANIRRQFVALAATQFDFREKNATNVEQFATKAAKSKAFGIKIHNNVKANEFVMNSPVPPRAA